MRREGLVGRGREVSALSAAQGEAQRGTKRALVLLGEPGVGKSALMNWSAQQASSNGFVCAITRVPSMGGVPPLFPVTEILGQLHSPEPSAGARSRRFQSRISSTDALSLARALEDAARVGPLGIYIDDIQWAPQEGLSTLYSALRLADVAALLVTTTRSGVDPGPLPVTSADLQVEFVVVPSLDPESIGAIAKQYLNGPVLPSLTRTLFGRTLGNPLLVKEMLRFWRDTEAIVTLPGGYWTVAAPQDTRDSRSLLEMIATRLRSLPQKALECAAVAALLGRGVRPDELRSVLGFSFSEIVESLASLETCGIAERERGTGKYVLAHPLFLSTLAQELGPTKTAEFHGRIFRMVAEAKDSSPAEIAYHGVRALERPPDLNTRLRIAAVAAERMGDYAQAAVWYEHLGGGADDSATLVASLAGRAAATEHYDPKRAVDIYSEALSTAEDHLKHAGLLIGRARAWRMAGRPDFALSDLEAASTLANGTESLEIRDATAVIHALMGHGELARAQFEALAEESWGTRIHARVIGHLATSEYFQGHIRESVRLFRQALSACDDAQTAQYLHMNLGWLETLLGEWHTARSLLDSEIEGARNSNDLWRLVPLLTSATVLALWQGDVDRALDLGAQAMRLTDETYLMDRLGAMGALGLVLFEKGMTVEAAELLAPAPAMVELSSEKNEVQLSLIVLADCFLSLGDLEGCRSVITQLRGTLEFNLSWKAAADRLESRFLLECGTPSAALDLLKPLLVVPAEAAIQQAEVYSVAASAYREMGSDPEADGALANAFGIYSSLGAQARRVAIEELIKVSSPPKRGRPRARVIADLTARELEVLEQVVKGDSNLEVAGSLFISMGTVKKHIENIRLKLGVRRRSDLISIGLEILREARAMETIGSKTDSLH